MSPPGPAAEAAALRRPGRWRVPARVLLALGLLAAVLLWADVGQVLALLRGAQPGWLLAALAAAVASNLASAWRWRLLVQWLGGPLGLGTACGLYFRAVAINALLPGAVVGGDMYRAHGLVRLGLPWLESALSVLCDRLSGLWVLIALGGLAAAWAAAWPGDTPLPAAIGLLPPAGWAALALALLALPLVLLTAGRKLVAGPAKAAPAAAGGAGWRVRLSLLAHRPQALAQYGWQLLGSALVQGLSVSVLALGGAALGIALPWWGYALAAVPTFLMATLPISLGGWGTREAAAVLAFGSLGLAAPQAVALSVLYGLSALVQAAAGALLLARGAPAVPVEHGSADARPGG